MNNQFNQMFQNGMVPDVPVVSDADSEVSKIN